MGLGVGLGAFMDGFQQGYGVRRQMNEDRRAEADRTKADANEAAITGINQGAKAEFDAQVAAGTAEPGDFEAFWTTNALPMMVNELLAQGDSSGAKALQDWADSADAKKGAALFGKAMLLSQTGNPGGALAAAIEAGQLGDYIDHGMEFVGQEEIVDPSGNLLGFRLTTKGADGKESSMDIGVEQIPQVIATYLNPTAAWESQVAASSKAAERNAELEDFEAKETIKDRHEETTETGPTRQDAVEALTKGLPGDAALGEPGFLQMPVEQREKLIDEWMTMSGGSALPPLSPSAATLSEGALTPSKVLVDENTGRTLSPASGVTQQTAAPGITPAVDLSANVDPMRPGSAAPNADTVTPAAPTTKDAVINGTADPGLALPNVDQNTLLSQRASQMILEGGDPNEIARSLANSNVPPEMWPDALKKAVGVGNKAR